MATLGSLIISLEANTAKFESAMTKAQYTAKKSSDVIKASLMEIGAVLASAFAIGKLEDAITGIAKMEGDLLKMAGRLNTSVETLSSFGVMARKTGMDTDSFYLALTRMEKGMSAAAAKVEIGTGKFDENGEEIMKAAATYDELGLNVEKLLKLPLEDQLKAIAEGFKNNIDPADRVRIAMELFGRSGAGMVNILKGGAADIEKWIKQQQDLGIITTENAKKAAEFNNAVASLTAAWQTFKREILEGVIPALVGLIDKINQAISTSRQMSLNKEFAEQHFPGYQPYKLGAGAVSGQGPWGEAAGEPGAVSPMPYKPPAELFKPAIRPGEKVTGGGGKGGGGGGDMGLDRMQSIIDTLQKDLSRLTEGSLAEIREWANKTRTEIEKVGRKGADTERAMTLTAEVEAAKKKKATEDYELFVARESGNAFKQIEADNKDWLNKYKGFADAEANIKKITERKKWEEEAKQNSDRLGMQKGYLESVASEMPLLSQRIEIKKRTLPIETELMEIELKRRLVTMQISEAQKDELKALMALSVQAKKYGAEREKWRTEGTVGGLKIAAEDMKKQAETWAADTTAQFVEKMPNQLSSMIANSLVAFLQGKETDFKALGISMAQSFLQTMLEGILQQIIPEMLSGLADGMKGILESLGGELGGMLGGGGGIFGTIAGFFGFHEGGMIRAHRGWPGLRNDEIPIIAQTGERVLSRDQNRAYEAGRAGGGSSQTNIYVHLPNQSQMELDRFARNLTRSIKRHENRRIT